MHSKYVYLFLLISCAGYALWRGRGDERVAAAVCLLATALSHVILHSPVGRFQQLETGILAIDVLALLGFVAIALWSQRFWPLWVAGLQLTTSIGHLLKAIDWSLVPRAYAVATIFWSYPILIIIAVGAWRADRRRRAAGHPTA